MSSEGEGQNQDNPCSDSTNSHGASPDIELRYLLKKNDHHKKSKKEEKKIATKKANRSSKKATTVVLSRARPSGQKKGKIIAKVEKGKKIVTRQKEKKKTYENRGKIASENQRYHRTRPKSDTERRVVTSPLIDYKSNRISFENLLVLKSFYKSVHPGLEREFEKFVMCKILNKELEIV